MNIFLDILILLILLLLAAVTAASEIAIIAASRIKLRKLSSEGSKAAAIILKMLEIPERFFGTILVANNVVNSLIAVLVTALFIRFLGDKAGIVLATLISSFLIIVFEVTGKTLAAKYSERLSLFLARPIQLLIKMLSPVVKVIEAIIRVLIDIVGGKTQKAPSLVTEEEIRALIKIGEKEGLLHKEKYKMLSKVFDFNEAIIRDVMTPKKDIVAIDISMKFDDMLSKVLESGYSRIPVYKDNPENIIGVINMKDLLNVAFNRELFVLQDIVYPVTVVPGSRKVTELLKEFQKGHTHLALVTNNNNRIEGIVTLEDLLEEIVGEIEDEHDVRASNYKTKIL